MDSSNTLITGIAPEHVPALIAALFLPVAVWAALAWMRGAAAGGTGWAQRFLARLEASNLATRVTAALLLTTGVVHLALPLGHNDAPALTLMFLGSGAAFVALAVNSFSVRPPRLRTALLLTASIVAYLVVAGSGWQEEPDQAGIATKLVELTALGLVIIPAMAPAQGRRRRLARPLASSAFVLMTVVTGTVIWIGSFVAHTHGNEAIAAAAPHGHAPGTLAHDHDSGHSHSFAARAQAGVIMRPGSTEPATPEQTAAAAFFAEQTSAGIARYQDVDAAVADGYAPDGPKFGLEVHYSNKAFKKDGLSVDPARPEMLVYGVQDGRYLLLGAVYVMEKAGVAGTEIGGPATRWHSHNICVTPLPPGFGLVSPFGTCPLVSVAVTLPEMIHVWVVPNPGGPYAEGLDDKLVRGLLARP